MYNTEEFMTSMLYTLGQKAKENLVRDGFLMHTTMFAVPDGCSFPVTPSDDRLLVSDAYAAAVQEQVLSEADRDILAYFVILEVQVSKVPEELSSSAEKRIRAYAGSGSSASVYVGPNITTDAILIHGQHVDGYQAAISLPYSISQNGQVSFADEWEECSDYMGNRGLFRNLFDLNALLWTQQ